MRIDRAGWPFIVGALLLAIVVAWWAGRFWAVPLFVLAGFFVFFFRDPDRRIPDGAAPHRVASRWSRDDCRRRPGPGSPAGTWQQISIFLSPMDVHVNRAPVAGVVTPRGVSPRQVPAGLPRRRRHAQRMDGSLVRSRGTLVVCRQIVGILARRIVTRLAVGQQVAPRRTIRHHEVRLAHRLVLAAVDAAIAAKVGDRVIGGESVLATLALATAEIPSAAALGVTE